MSSFTMPRIVTTTPSTSPGAADHSAAPRVRPRNTAAASSHLALVAGPARTQTSSTSDARISNSPSLSISVDALETSVPLTSRLDDECLRTGTTQ